MKTLILVQLVFMFLLLLRLWQLQLRSNRLKQETAELKAALRSERGVVRRLSTRQILPFAKHQESPLEHPNLRRAGGPT